MSTDSSRSSNVRPRCRVMDTLTFATTFQSFHLWFFCTSSRIPVIQSKLSIQSRGPRHHSHIFQRTSHVQQLQSADSLFRVGWLFMRRGEGSIFFAFVYFLCIGFCPSVDVITSCKRRNFVNRYLDMGRYPRSDSSTTSMKVSIRFFLFSLWKKPNYLQFLFEIYAIIRVEELCKYFEKFRFFLICFCHDSCN